MELMQLRYFLEAARRENMTRAAEHLNITQPALSKAIARLEEDLGVRLFDREGKNIRLNEYGQAALRAARQILFTIDDLRAELDELSSGRAGTVRIGSSFPSGEPNWLLEQVRTFALSRPDVGFQLKQYPVQQLQAALEQREIELAVSSAPLREEGILWTELFAEPMGVILSAGHPLAERQELSMEDLRGERFYCNNANSDVQELTYHFCRLAGFRPNVHFEGEFPSFIGRAVSLGYGISIIARRGYEASAHKASREPWEDNIVFRPLKESYCRRVCGVACLKDRRLSTGTRAFYDHLVRSVSPPAPSPTP